MLSNDSVLPAARARLSHSTSSASPALSALLTPERSMQPAGPDWMSRSPSGSSAAAVAKLNGPDTAARPGALTSNRDEPCGPATAFSPYFAEPDFSGVPGPRASFSSRWITASMPFCCTSPPRSVRKLFT